MAGQLKPFTLYMRGIGPNPWKVIFILEELGLPYERSVVEEKDLKIEPYISINPNGRLPGLIDPNKDITLWESGAIIDYLISEYDPDHTLQYTSFPEKHQTRCWEHFQMSGQGPYFGQLAWFKFYHHERIPSAVERYAKEASRVTAVINAHLAKTGSNFLVGDKCTYADIMWVPYYLAARHIYTEHMDFTQWPHFSAWLERILERPAASQVVKEYEDAVAELTEERKRQAERDV